MSLYNCRLTPSGFRFAKFDDDFNVQALYHVDPSGRYCDCPASFRPTCPHRQMLPIFRAANAVDSGRFYDREAEVWLHAVTEELKLQPITPLPTQSWRRI